MRTVVLVATVLLAGCAKPVTALVAAKHGSADLKCEYAKVSAYLSSDGTWIAKGCGQWAEYSCSRSYRSDGFLWVTSEPAGTAICNRIAVHTLSDSR
jgi:hypothetical protein